jgi:origin recognition complex subunit 6
MSRPVERVLNEIIPRLSGPLPPELIDLASALLAQSRSKISNLKAEEEIGRTYACANIACERYDPLLRGYLLDSSRWEEE